MPEAPKELTDDDILSFLTEPDSNVKEKSDVKLAAQVPDDWDLADSASAQVRLKRIAKAAGIAVKVKILDAKEKKIEIEFIGIKTLISESTVKLIEELGVQFVDPIPLQRDL